MNSIFYPAGGRNNRRNKNLDNIEQRVENEAIRKKIGPNKHFAGSGTNITQAEQFVELLRLATDGKESPYNRTRLFALGRAGCGKEALLSSLFGLDLKEDTSGDMQPIVMGRYDPDSFNETLSFNKKKIEMEVWNYSWKAVYNYLQDLFMTEYTLYLFVYDIQKILSEDDKVRNESLTYLEDILHSKKLQAPGAPVFLVGTNAGSPDDIAECERIIKNEILRGINFGIRPMNPGSICAAVNCETGDGIDVLKTRIRLVLRSDSSYCQKNVPTIILDAEKTLKSSGRPYLSYAEAKRLLRVKDDDVCELLLKILAERGMIIFLHKYESLRKFIIIQPEWLTLACGVPIFKDGKHKPLSFDIDNNDMTNAFNVFVYQRVLSKDFLFHVLGRMNYPKEVHSYLLDLMKSTCMIADYLFDSVESYLTPTFFDNLRGRNKPRTDIINEDDYKGPYFVIDFSGDHTNKIVTDNGNMYSCFMPFSFFEKLVSLSIQLSASFGQGVQPITRYKKARLSFGAEVDFMLSVLENDVGRPLQIKVSTLTDTPQEKANDLLERLFSMARGIRKDFYTGVEDTSRLALSVLVPPKDGSIRKLTNYEEIQTAKSRNITAVRPNFRRPGTVPIAEFDRWHRAGEPLKVGDKITYVPREADGTFPLPEGKTQHCFLSYKESSALKEVERQLNDLRALGYVCWLNKEYKGELNMEVYLKQVQQSMCFILVLSAEVFESPIIVEELRTAISHNVPIIFLHHPDTDKLGYWTFSQYITSCPADLRHLFNEVESIPLFRRFYLQEAVTNNLVARITEVMNS